MAAPRLTLRAIALALASDLHSQPLSNQQDLILTSNWQATGSGSQHAASIGITQDRNDEMELRYAAVVVTGASNGSGGPPDAVRNTIYVQPLDNFETASGP